MSSNLRASLGLIDGTLRWHQHTRSTGYVACKRLAVALLLRDRASMVEAKSPDAITDASQQASQPAAWAAGKVASPVNYL